MSGDLFEGERLRDEGVARVSINNSDWLRMARAVAKRIDEFAGEVTADDIRNVVTSRPGHPNTWGAIFLGAALRRRARGRTG